MPIERRRTPRRTLTDLAFINLEPDNGGIVVDVSEEGLGFHAAVPVEASGPLKFWFSIRSIERVDASGVIAWTDSSRKSGGIRFVNLNDDAREKLRSWLGDPGKISNSATTTSFSGAVTPDSPADVARHAAARPPSSTAGTIYSSFRDAILPAQKNKAPEENSEPVPAVSESPRPSILTSPLSLLATEPDPHTPDSRDPHLTESYGATRATADVEDRDRAALPMIVVVLAAIVVTVIGYYTLRWKTQSRPTALQQQSVPGSQSGDATPPIVPAPSSPDSANPVSPNDATSSPANAAPSTSSSGSENKTSAAPPPAPSPAASDAVDTGETELGEARLLLRPSNAARNPTRAAQLLWIAVGKGSVAAEVDLAGLYIRGDGVRKNCEQARVLLRAAATKGSDAANQQLADLIRSGCVK